MQALYQRQCHESYRKQKPQHQRQVEADPAVGSSQQSTRRGRRSSTSFWLRRPLIAVAMVASFAVCSSALEPAFMSTPTSGPIDEAMVTCHMEDLEHANDVQLHSILHELTQTAFFRTFRVDLSQKCPLRSWGGSDGHEEEEEKEFECPSAKAQKDEFSLLGGAPADEEDEGPALCTVDLGGGGPAAEDLQSNALFSLSQDGFQSQAQKETFSWQQHSDRVVTPIDAIAPESKDDVSEDDCENLPDDFWIDLCTRVRNDDPSVVDLHLNPERNTGYNGTHIWTAIYEENCRAVSPDSDADVCLEERVLYRLFSGLHASTTLSIAKNYYPPSKRKGRVDWEANPTFFMEKFGPHPDHVRNLHFSYVVLLRALAKASPFLHAYGIRTGDVVEDETATVLLQRLLDSSILKSCSPVFSAFDESLMFAEKNPAKPDFSLQHSFKDVFFNVSSILDCVQCQQCKLHGKMAMLGYGAALKVLFSPPGAISLETLTRNEIVAFINTLAKFSESIRHVRELTTMYVASEAEKVTTAEAASPKPLPIDAADGTILSISAVDAAIGAIASLARQDQLSVEQESMLVQMALQRQPELLVLARHYASDPARFLQLSQLIMTEAVDDRPDAIVIGSGLAGMAAALNILDRGGKVILLEKEHLLGGNSNKASSGINACCPDDDQKSYDSVELFRNDTEKSAGASVRPDLINVLVENSGKTVDWLRERVGVDLSLKAQLGGHSAKRTHRPNNGMAGAEIIYNIQKAVKSYQGSGQVSILTDSKVIKLIHEEGRVVGVEYVSTLEDEASAELKSIYADNVILATGGFAADRTQGSYLSQYRPELLKMPTTAGAFSTGDGITLATDLGAGRVDMDKVQLHPTGWVDPAEPEKKSKILAAELMRGVGGMLINDQGQRFCNELGTRAYVTDQMLGHNQEYAETKQWNLDAPIPKFSLVLSSSAALDGKKHVDLYTHKGLMKRLEGVTELAKWMGQPRESIVATMKKYQSDAKAGSDMFGKTTFKGVPQENLDTEVFYAGTVTPVLHYCMGGITIDTQGNVLNDEGEIISGLHAAGEVTGGVHGANRLGGNSLLECAVYGSLVGKKIPIKVQKQTATSQDISAETKHSAPAELRAVDMAELAQHDTAEDCWVAIHGVVYDLTSFAEEHPAGPESIHALAGKDGTEAFAAVHNAGILEEVFEDVIGKLVDDGTKPMATSIDQPTIEDSAMNRDEGSVDETPPPERKIERSSGFSSFLWSGGS